MYEKENLLTPDELATKLKVGKSWVYARTRETGPDAMPRIYVGKYLRHPEKAVMAWLQRRQR